MAYVVSAHKPTSVRHAIFCSFLSPTSQNLILASSNILQIYEYDSTTGQCIPVAEHALHARILSLALHRPPHYAGQDHLFMLTDNYVAFTCSWDTVTQQLRNEKVIDGLYESSLRPAEQGELVRCDPGHRTIGMSLYQGLLTFLLIQQPIPSSRRKQSNSTQVPEGTILEAVSLRIRVLNLVNFTFLERQSVYPVVVVLWKDEGLRRFISVWEIDKLYKTSDRDFVEKPWANGENAVLVDAGANLLIPTKNGGVIVVGEQTIAYYSMMLDSFRYIIPQPTIFECWTPVKSENEEWILGDAEGRIYSLSMDNDEFLFTKLGETSIPSTLLCLDDSTLFVGSHFGDTITLSLTPNLHPKQTIITNLAPISDFLVLPPSHPQAGALITCSGGFGQGTLRVVRQGVGIEDYAAVDFEGIRGTWTLSGALNGMDIDAPPRDTVLVLGLIERTVFLEMDEEGGLEAVESVNGLISQEETIALKEVEGKIVQVTTEQVLVVLKGEKVAGYPGKVSAAQISDGRIAISTGRTLTLLSFDCQVIQQWTLPEEITCLDIQGDLIAVGLWDASIQLINLPSNKTFQFDTPLSAPARSIILTDILPTPTLLIGSRDGVLTAYSLPTPTIPKDKKTVSLGTQPLRLFPVHTPTQNLIFASSDRPTLIHAPSKRDGSKKLVLSALSLRDVLSLTPLRHPAYPDALVIATKEGFRIGKMDQMARLQVRSVGMPNGELPRRIARIDPSDITSAVIKDQTAAGLVGVISLRVSIDINGSEITEGYLRVWDEDSWQCIEVIKFPAYDFPQAISAVELMNVSTDETKRYFVVGSAVEISTEDEPKEGNIRVYEVVESGGRRRLNLFAHVKVSGSVYCVDECDGKLVCGIGSTVRVYDLTHETLAEVAVYRAPLTALTIATRSPFILLGDLMKSVTLLRLETTGGKAEIESVARDYAPLWMTSVSIFDDSWFFGAEDSGNLVGWKREDDLKAEGRLAMVHEMRFGEMINRIRLGSLSHSEISGVETKALFATVDGTIGIVATLSEEKFLILETVERKMEENDMSLGNLDHARWRAFSNGRKKALRSKGFIDGDFVEGFMDLDAETRAKCCEGINGGVEEIQRLIEELSRLH